MHSSSESKGECPAEHKSIKVLSVGDEGVLSEGVDSSEASMESCRLRTVGRVMIAIVDSISVSDEAGRLKVALVEAIRVCCTLAANLARSSRSLAANSRANIRSALAVCSAIRDANSDGGWVAGGAGVGCALVAAGVGAGAAGAEGGGVTSSVTSSHAVVAVAVVVSAAGVGVGCAGGGGVMWLNQWPRVGWVGRGFLSSGYVRLVAAS